MIPTLISKLISIPKNAVRIACVVSLGSLAAFSIAGAAGDDPKGYNHNDWPVTQVEPGVYRFDDTALANAPSLCAAFYAADIDVMKENDTAATPTGQIVYAHALQMQAAFMKSELVRRTGLEELVKDMTWHFGNAAQYGVFQEFKDSANSACENNALENSLIDVDMIIAFNDKLLRALAQ